MSITTMPPTEDATAERWRQWQLRSAAGSRTSATHVRIAFTVIFIALAVWLGVELLSSPLWS
jgi:hypothetical protein